MLTLHQLFQTRVPRVVYRPGRDLPTDKVTDSVYKRDPASGYHIWDSFLDEARAFCGNSVDSLPVFDHPFPVGLGEISCEEGVRHNIYAFFTRTLVEMNRERRRRDPTTPVILFADGSAAVMIGHPDEFFACIEVKKEGVLPSTLRGQEFARLAQQEPRQHRKMLNQVNGYLWHNRTMHCGYGAITNCSAWWFIKVTPTSALYVSDPVTCDAVPGANNISLHQALWFYHELMCQNTLPQDPPPPSDSGGSSGGESSRGKRRWDPPVYSIIPRQKSMCIGGSSAGGSARVANRFLMKKLYSLCEALGISSNLVKGYFQILEAHEHKVLQLIEAEREQHVFRGKLKGDDVVIKWSDTTKFEDRVTKYIPMQDSGGISIDREPHLQTREKFEEALVRLDAIHARGFIHGKIQPASILVTRDDEIRWIALSEARPGNAQEMVEERAQMQRLIPRS
ncbi:hypothetical protein SELMODRAFT_419732 [Selaginella moellendorffii]|uniref:Protein kinase domain-containing protein n=1 Tax=Selaginella moellendorffii TaxID=88036 RepID=D8S9V6_SELML|nr:hypothetical protein SELMODRAFT_419732 [Selaginella moellendorffii]